MRFSVERSSGPPAEIPHEVVVRPEPGLARGAWEAPAWAFWAVLGVAFLGAALYLVRRVGRRHAPRGPRS